MEVPSLQVLANAVVTGLLLGGLFAITALGLSFVLGVMRVINLVHGELVIAGAYLGWVILHQVGLDPLLAMLIVAPVMFALAFPIQRWLVTPLMGKGAEGPLLTTFGLSIILQNVFILVFSGDTQAISTSYASKSVAIGGLAVPLIYGISFVIALGLGFCAHFLLQNTVLGRQIRASSEDAVAAEMIGVNVPRVYAITYGLGAACAAIGGVLAGTAFSFTPTSGITYLLTGFAVVVLGGLGSVRGTILGGLTIGLLEGVGGAFFGDGYRDFIGYVAFLIILALRPQGFFGRTNLVVAWRT